MTDYTWPADIVPTASEWRLVANTAAFSSPLAGTTRTLARGGDRWACSLQFTNLTEAKRARLQSFLARLRGQANRVWLWDHAYRKRGSFPTGELLPDPLNASAASWATAYATVEVSDGIVRLTAGAHTAGQFPLAQQTVTTATGSAYVARAAFSYASSTAVTFGVEAQSAPNSSPSYTTALGLKTASVIAGGTVGKITLLYDDDVVAGNVFDVGYISFACCPLVAGASQTGSVVSIDTIPVADTDILMPGDLVQIGDYLYMVTARCNSVDGRLHITPPLRTSPADNTPVIIHQPMARMMLADQSVGWSNQPGGRIGSISSMTVEFMEDLA
jgi:hypothetical protein